MSLSLLKVDIDWALGAWIILPSEIMHIRYGPCKELFECLRSLESTYRFQGIQDEQFV